MTPTSYALDDCFNPNETLMTPKQSHFIANALGLLPGLYRHEQSAGLDISSKEISYTLNDPWDGRTIGRKGDAWLVDFICFQMAVLGC